jgi:hypothetical protein
MGVEVSLDLKTGIITTTPGSGQLTRSYSTSIVRTPRGSEMARRIWPMASRTASWCSSRSSDRIGEIPCRTKLTG